MFKEDDSLDNKLSVANSMLEAVENLVKALEYRKNNKNTKFDKVEAAAGITLANNPDEMAITALTAEVKRIGSWANIRKFTIPEDNEFLFVALPEDTTSYQLTAIAQSIRRTLKMKEEKLLIATGDVKVQKFTVPKDDEFLFVTLPEDTTLHDMAKFTEHMHKMLNIKEEKLLIATNGVDLETLSELDKQS